MACEHAPGTEAEARPLALAYSVALLWRPLAAFGVGRFQEWAQTLKHFPHDRNDHDTFGARMAADG
jgi:hypothetical protein